MLFLGHGSPSLTFQNNSYTKLWEELGKALPHPKCILIISAHWETDGVKVTGSSALRTIHDYWGFPREFYEYDYKGTGNPDLALRISQTLQEVELDYEWGLDHGSWSLLKHMYPESQIPIVQMSLNRNWNLAQHWEFAKKLDFLRKEGVLIIGSGNLVHSLKDINFKQEDLSHRWAKQFDQEVVRSLMEKDRRILELPFDEKFYGPKAHPTLEHYIPLLYPAALAIEEEDSKILIQKVVHGSISMTSLQF